MIIKHKENFEETQKRMDAFWNKDYTDRCCLAIRLPKENPGKLVLPRDSYTLEETRTDAGYAFLTYEHWLKSSVFLAESLPALMPGFGVAAHSCYFGSKLRHAPETIWFEPVIHEPDISRLVYDGGALETHKKYTAELAKRAKGLFMIGNNDNCGIIDALVNLRGNANLLLDMIESPGFVEAARDKITEVWKKTQREFYDITKETNNGGSSHGWMHTWSKGIHGQLQCDFCVMISPAHFERFVLPELEDCTEFYDNSTYHFDGQEQIRHLDMLLSVKNLDNIQWTPVAGQPPTSEFIGVFQKIQKAGKGLVLIPSPDEIPVLLQNLSHKGLMIVANGIRDIDEANDLIRLAMQYAN
jgi:hypothetical protein